MDIQIQKVQWLPSRLNPKDYTKTYYNQTVIRQIENLESSKRKATCHVQGFLNKTINGFLSRNLAGQKAVGWYIYTAERKILSTENSIFSETVL